MQLPANLTYCFYDYIMNILVFILHIINAINVYPTAESEEVR